MGANDRGALRRCQHMGGYAAADPLIGLRWRYAADESLARCADKQWELETPELVEPREANDALLGGLAESNARIEHDVLACNPGARRDIERSGKECDDIGNDVDARIGVFAVMHDDHGNAAPGGERRHLRIPLKSPNVIDDDGALVECP